MADAPRPIPARRAPATPLLIGAFLGTVMFAGRSDAGLRHLTETPLRLQHQEQLRPARPDGAAAGSGEAGGGEVRALPAPPPREAAPPLPAAPAGVPPCASSPGVELDPSGSRHVHQWEPVWVHGRRGRELRPASGRGEGSGEEADLVRLVLGGGGRHGVRARGAA